VTAGGRPERAGADPQRREREIVEVLRALDEGEVTTYGDVAEVAGHPRQARLVGRILAAATHDVPWWRVVNAQGRIVSGSPRVQAGRLREEGVVVRDGRVVDAPVGRFARPSATGRRRAAPR
jgi:methylated-DNA-protein-cysteine methyltransferase-like protein